MYTRFNLLPRKVSEQVYDNSVLQLIRAITDLSASNVCTRLRTRANNHTF